jgi:hypothetical protein
VLDVDKLFIGGDLVQPAADEFSPTARRWPFRSRRRRHRGYGRELGREGLESFLDIKSILVAATT